MINSDCNSCGPTNDKALLLPISQPVKNDPKTEPWEAELDDLNDITSDEEDDYPAESAYPSVSRMWWDEAGFW